MQLEWLTNARTMSGELVDVLVDHSGPRSIIADIRPNTGAPIPDPPVGTQDDPPDTAAPGATMSDTAPMASPAITDLKGWLLLPAPVEPHAHLDKAFLAESVSNPTGDLTGAIAAMQDSAAHRSLTETTERAERAARRFARNGYASIRSHVDISDGDTLRSTHALIEVRRRLADLIDIQLVGLVGIGFSERSGAHLLSMLDEGLEMGIDLIGGCPHLESESQRATDVLLQRATERGIGVDLHTDETLDPAATGLEELVSAVEAGFDLPVTASHCVALGQRPVHQQAALAERVSACEIGVVTLPYTNLFLQGRDHHPMPRGLTAVGELQRAGVAVGAGADNVQDPFNPVGRACPFETARLMMLTAHLLPDEAWATVSTAAAQVVGTPRSLREGQPADLLAVDASTLREAIAEAPQRRRWSSQHVGSSSSAEVS